MKLYQNLQGTYGAVLRIPHASKTLQEEAIAGLTYDNPAYLQAKKFTRWGYVSPKIPPKICLASLAPDGVLELPRSVESLGILKRSALEFSKVQWTDLTTTAPVKFPPLQLTLNEDQKSLLLAHQRAEKLRLRPFGASLFVASTSAGKTLTQAAIAAHLGQQTLVLCQTNQIKEAWIGDLKKGFGFARKDIGLIQQSSWSIGAHFTLASLSTLGRRYHRWTELFEQFGTLIVDEADILQSAGIVKFVFSCPMRNIIGATATDAPKNFYLRACFGPPVRVIAPKQKDTASSHGLTDVETVDTGFQYSYQEQNLDWHDLSEHLATDEERNALVVKKCAQQWRDGHSLLIVTKRVPHAHLLKSMLKEAGVQDANLLTGETNADREYTKKLIKGIFSRSIRCVVATLQAIKRGANLNPLDRLHLVMPPANQRDLEQVIGRIRRKADGKDDCILTYYRDVQVDYLRFLYRRAAIPVFQKLKVKRFEEAKTVTALPSWAVPHPKRS